MIEKFSIVWRMEGIRKRREIRVVREEVNVCWWRVIIIRWVIVVLRCVVNEDRKREEVSCKRG